VTCSRKIGPFDCCSVVQGDCLELMRQIPGKYFDLALTDPPYGIGIAANPVRQMHAKSDWDDAPPPAEMFDELRRVSREQIIWGGNYFDLPPSKGFLVWDKQQPEDFTLAMCEQAWTSIQKPAKLFRKSVLSYSKEHPTQKPEELMEWCLKRAGGPDVVFDPIAGSGTTLVAAKKAGKHFLGFEISPEYCEIARKRLDAIDAQPQLFSPKPEQLALA
jgi:DNA modification methylase